MSWSHIPSGHGRQPTLGTVAYHIAQDRRIEEAERQHALQILQDLTRGYGPQDPIPQSTLSRLMTMLAQYFNPSTIKGLLADLL